MKIETCMKRNVVFIPLDTTIGDAAQLMVKKHIGILPVVDENEKPVGVVSMSDLLTLELPDFIELFEDLDFVHDFGAVETTRPEQDKLSEPVSAVMHVVKAIEEDGGLLRGYALMIQNDLYDLPVINKSGKLVGVVSRVDIGTTLLSNWSTVVKK
jgi:CBS-domain-containing membrane protein